MIDNSPKTKCADSKHYEESADGGELAGHLDLSVLWLSVSQICKNTTT